ncbi:uncharacterized protein ACB058_003413 [Synchiropus picturatus]
MWLLNVLTALCTCVTVCGADGCSGFKHLENGRTFFRYGGLMVVYSCRPGYKLHGYRTNSCVAGHWSRDPPVCVGFGCSSPGPITHGTSSMTDDGSAVMFSCSSGFRLHGPSKLFCKGHIWNGSKPECRELDQVAPDVQVEGTNSEAVVVKEGSQNSPTSLIFSKDIPLDSLSSIESQTQTNLSTQDVNSTTNSQNDVSLLNLTTTRLPHAASIGPQTTLMKHELAEGDTGRVTQTSPRPSVPSKSPLPAAVSATVSLESRKASTAFSGARTLTVSVASSVTLTSTVQQNKLSTSTSTPQEFTILTSEAQLTRSYPPSSAPRAVSSFSETLLHDSTSAAPSLRPDSSVYLTPSPSALHLQTESVPVTNPDNGPVCPSPPVPAHGSVHFHSEGTSETKLYIQYRCSRGYTLAHGDAHSICQEGGTWSGVTPVCVASTSCAIDNGGCSQLCLDSSLQNQTSHQTHSRSHCRCRSGFFLLEDGRTCRDINECLEHQNQCQHRCINSFGSFTCACDDGYQLSSDQTSCTDVDECLQPAAVTLCIFSCVNTPGSFYCHCPAGYQLQTGHSHCQDIDECAGVLGRGPCAHECHNSPGSFSCSCSSGHVLAGDGLTCVSECPAGFRKRQISTEKLHDLREECADINECEALDCDWRCVNLPGSYRCICPKGYSLHTDGRRCLDVNECSRKNGGCSHLCVNQRGGHKCACPSTHRLSSYSWKKCVPRARK